jgi:hypothetical protein
MFDKVRCLALCYNVINRILIVLMVSSTSPGRTIHHVSVADACSDDILRKL